MPGTATLTLADGTKRRYPNVRRVYGFIPEGTPTVYAENGDLFVNPAYVVAIEATDIKDDDA